MHLEILARQLGRPQRCWCPTAPRTCGVGRSLDDYSCTPSAAIQRAPAPYFFVFSLTKAPACPCHHFSDAIYAA